MAKKTAIIAIEFDDPEDNFVDASDLALFVEAELHDLGKPTVAVYASPAALNADIADGFGIFAKGREDAGVPIKSQAEVEFNQSAKPR